MRYISDLACNITRQQFWLPFPLVRHLPRATKRSPHSHVRDFFIEVRSGSSTAWTAAPCFASCGTSFPAPLEIFSEVIQTEASLSEGALSLRGPPICRRWKRMYQSTNRLFEATSGPRTREQPLRLLTRSYRHSAE